MSFRVAETRASHTGERAAADATRVPSPIVEVAPDAAASVVHPSAHHGPASARWVTWSAT